MSSPDDYRVLREAAGLIDRSSSRGRLRLVGPDRRAYLQGLLTNDIAALHSGTGCYTAYLTPQGRMLADMRVFELGDALLVDLESDVAESVRARWEQFIFSEEVSVEAVSASTAQIGVYGPRAAFVLESGFAGGRDSEEPSPRAEALRTMTMHANSRWDFHGAPAFVLRSDDIGVDGFDLVVPLELKPDLVERLTEAGAVSVGNEAVEVCRIEAGLPRFHIDMDEDTIPLEAGIEDRAISLTKGCYVGQEIIIRVLHRGHGRVARKLVGFLLDSSAAVPARGEKVASGEREIGAITSAVRSRALERPIALGYVHRDFVQPGTSVSVNGSPAAISGLPFVS
jgi:folate-binding protein YgfZ